MATRNTPVLQKIVAILGLPDEDAALVRLEEHYRDSLLINAGNIETVARMAEDLRLAITTAECHTVLNHIAAQALAGINIDIVEEVINDLFPDRFIEP